MPKLPRSANSGRGKAAATKKPKNGSKGDGAVAAAEAAPNFQHRQVDEAAGNGASNAGGGGTATIELNKFERGLLSDLLAVIEEHAREGGDAIDRSMVERAFVFAC